VRFGAPVGECYFDCSVDGDTRLVSLPRESGEQLVAFDGLSSGPHELRIFKRSEAKVGHVRLLGIDVPKGSRRDVPERSSRPKLLFLGDSITAAACSEDGEADQWEDLSTHNFARSYAALSANQLDAELQAIAVSGMGVVAGYVDVRAGDVWDRLYPEPQAPRADLSRYQPDVVFILLGENDDSFTKTNRRAFPPRFVPEYEGLVRAVRKAYPAALIVCARGGMAGGGRSQRLRGPWETAVARLEKGDARVRRFAFDFVAELHPRAAEHQRLADELVPFLQRLLQKN
jgi:lysophospholipase L1-like esterase